MKVCAVACHEPKAAPPASHHVLQALKPVSVTSQCTVTAVSSTVRSRRHAASDSQWSCSSPLQALGQGVVDDKVHVRLVDAHAKGDGGHNDLVAADTATGHIRRVPL